MKKTKLVSYTVDLDKLPPLTEEQKAGLEVLAATPDEAIDYSAIPPLPETFWENAVRGWFRRRTWPRTTLRIDPEVMDWLGTEGAKVEFRINAILRHAMLAALKKG